ncbi:U3 snoRNP-associated protein Utp3 [Schizosaccharomyces japonicus yFS275]|uniref:U3 snoRNP-associated protein Utp3 n=1 Tax=Schizosaccharomyces japonicus (strain yFS275 / FY16936) TaxID=402676 RepID=B6JZ81_SCHJY|nr:U3 snoRNP-associated protein Utp3 [Schizosaccharomyces japonicus yFS275]EEB06849.1 U3 snoRNP-associated protein Utp3 [Schizosaccharomyces japonicus yFS275]
MARKKSRSSKSGSRDAPSFEIDEKQKVDAIETYDDVAESEDEFYAKQDKILFDDDNAGRGSRSAVAHEFSDEEVMGLETSSDDDEEDVISDDSSDNEKQPLDEQEMFDQQGWGHSRKAYYGGEDGEPEADEFSSGDEEVDTKMEEREALRLQKKRLQRLSEEDAMDDLSGWNDKAASQDSAAIDDNSVAAIEQLGQSISPETPVSELKRILKVKHPEFELFAQELKTLRPRLDELQQQRHDAPESRLLEAQCTSLGAYVASLIFYFALLKSGEDDVKSHPLMVDLVRCRETWKRFEGLKEEEESEEEELDAEAEIEQPQSDDEAEDEGVEVDAFDEEEEAGSDASFASDASESIESKFRQAKAAKGKRKNALVVDDFGENDELDELDAEDKIQRKRTLRFYASQIDQKAAKRLRAQAEQTGDTDLPFKERRFERQQHLDDVDPEQEQLPINAERPDLDEDALAFYDSLAKDKRAAKQTKKAEHDSERDLVRAMRHPELLSVEDGEKRGITRDIEKNKGLTPFRAKINRNPRLKKRMRYEKAKKKLASKKAIFKGAPTHGYMGEQSGIKAGLVKSIKFH